VCLAEVARIAVYLAETESGSAPILLGSSETPIFAPGPNFEPNLTLRRPYAKR